MALQQLADTMEFEELYKRISPRLKRAASFYNRRGHIFDRDDLFQEMAGYLWGAYKNGVPEGLNDTYIVKGCEFHILNYMRKEKEKVYRISLEEPINENGDILKENIADGQESLDKKVDKKMLVDYIMNNGFSKREKEVLMRPERFSNVTAPMVWLDSGIMFISFPVF